MKYVVFLLLTGCSYQSLDDLYQIRAACVAEHKDCISLDEQIEKKEILRDKLDERTRSHCGKDVELKIDDRYQCITHADLRRILR